MERTYLCIFLLMFAFVKAQVSMPVVLFGDEKYLLKQYEKQVLDKDFIANGYTQYITKLGDTLIVTVTNPQRSVRKLTFTGLGNTCDFDQITYLSCDSCTKYAIKDMLDSKYLGWKKMAENKYLSKWFWRTELVISNNPEGTSVMTFRCPKLEKVQYKRIYESGIYEPYIYDMGAAKDADWFNKGYDATKHKQYEEALAYYTKAIELDSTDSDAYCNRGNVKLKLERYEDAIRDCTRAIELNPNDDDAYANRGDAKYNLERYTEALVDYKKALQIEPTKKTYKKDLHDAYKAAYE